MAASQGEHARVIPGTLINNRYLIIKEVGCGNFSKVYQCKDTKSQQTASDGDVMALKILKKEYANDASFERDMLKVLAAKDSGNHANVSKMFDQFTWNRYPCFVMPLKGPSLRSRKFGISRGNVTRAEVIRLATSLVQSMKFVHFDCKMVHTDLKPENILLNADVPHLGDEWTICDFGSASLWRPDRMDSDLISTRPYRAPEVVLGNPWSYPADMWSIGCILYEAACGSRLFEVHDDNTHLHFMAARLGELPESYTKKSKHSKKFFDANGKLIRPLSSGAGASAATRAVAAAAGNNALPRHITEVLKDDPLLLDLIQSMLHYDPSRRIRADDALKHPALSGEGSAAEVNQHHITPRSHASSAPSGKPQSAEVLASDRHSSGDGAASAAYKYRGLPPLMNALNALGVDSSPMATKENMVTPSTAAAAKRPVQGVCRTPEELKKAPLSAHVGGSSKASAAIPSSSSSYALKKHQAVQSKYAFAAPAPPVAATPTSAVPPTKLFSAAAPKQPVATLIPAGKASGLQYYYGR